MPRLLNTLLNRWRGTSARPAPAPARTTFRPSLECLEDRRVPASIAGHVFVDTTGNGASSLGGGQGGVQIALYQERSGLLGLLNVLDLPAATKATGADGSYTFTGLAAGTYVVQESVPTGFVRTVPLLSSSYTVTLASGQAVTGEDFANFQKPNTSAVGNVNYTITDASGASRTVTSLRGQTHQGDTVTANFTVSSLAGSATVTLAAYNATGPTFDANTASQAVLAQAVTQTFGPGQHAVTVRLPNNYYEVDFAVGAALTQFGPAGSNLFYDAQGRLLSRDNGGTQPPAPPATATLSGTVTSDDNGNGVRDDADSGLVEATVTLTGTDVLGNAVYFSMPTDGSGHYCFTGLMAGTYTVTVTAYNYTDEQATAPPDNGTAGNGTIANVVVASGSTNTGFDFLELPPDYTPPGS